ncbi:MAG: ATP-binding protein [Planctomycetales bacterium]|nr:ATP-binding protein [Planctomycetales bacterium]
MNHHHWTWRYSEHLPSDARLGRQFVETVLDQLSQNGWSKENIYAVHLSLEEAMTNCIKHGNKHDECKSVRIECRLSPTRFWIELEDEGCGFDPENVPDCTAEENLDKPSGRGLLLMKHFMTRIEYNGSGNRVMMEKVLDE